MTALGFAFNASAVPPPVGFIGLPDDIPAIDELKAFPQWVAWKYVWRAGSKPTKPPVSPHTGQGASHSKPSDWGTYEQAEARAINSALPGVGFVLSEADGFTGADLDNCRDKATGQIAPWAREVLGLAETYAEVSPSGEGIRLIMRGKVDKATKCDPAGVEIYGGQRYLTITGNRIEGAPDAIHNAPRTLAALLARVEQIKPAPAAAPVVPPITGPVAHSARPASSSSSGGFFHDVNDASLANLSAWVPAIFGPAARAQGTTGAYRVSSRALGRSLQEDLSIAPNGIVDFGVHDMGDARDGKRTAIDVVMEHKGIPTASDAALWLCDRLGLDPARMGWETDGFKEEQEARGAEIARRILTTAEGEMIDEDTGEVLDLPTVDLSASDFPEAWLDVPGLVGDIASWIVKTSPRPSRLLAISAAIAALGALAGRRFYTGKPRSGTNLYMMMIANSGFGKERPQQAVRQLLAAAGAEALNAGSMSSSAALSVRLTERPSMIQIIDEIHRVFRQANSRGSSNQEMNLIQDMCTLWGRSDDEFIPQSTTTRGDVVIKRPTLSVFGATVPDAFYKQLRGEMVSNGFLNRFLILPCYRRPPRNRNIPDNVDVPAPIAAAVRAIYDFPSTGGDMPLIHTNNPTQPPPHVVVPMSAGAEAAYFGFEDEIDAYLDDNGGTPSAEVKKRLPDIAKRIALIVAVGRHTRDLRRAVVDAQDFAFARRLVEWSAGELIRGIDENLSENEHQANAKMVLGLVRGAGQIGRSELLRKLDGRLDAKTLSSVIGLLKDAHSIEELKVTQPGAGRPATTYRFLS